MLLLDSSAIVNLVKRGDLSVFTKAHTLDLALYESLNAVWKEVHLIKRINLETGFKLTEIIANIFNIIEVHTIKESEKEVLGFSLKEGLTIYDASYIYVAMKEKLTLVTDDAKLRQVASKYVKALPSIDISKENKY
ncbi:type II toxin-antitoxin system VapC family toxin [Desulfurococcus amylolyticus]|uniref:type II toxin-antitoxin system VapC family toxin n=1 Tax=Desulfurococcus amylolyticus TaxID=94694 RepID=UPI0005B22C20|nr:type II toxin-antitoxin system VapC family toxin [Desulfurococcus amylolyticus]